MTTARPVRTTDRLTVSEISGVLALADAAQRADGTYPLSEDAVLAVRHAGPGAASGGSARVHMLVQAEDGLAGYAYLDGTDGELVVAPRHRREGYGSALLAAAEAVARGGELRFWAHGDEAGARNFAERAGFARVRVLWQMRRSLTEPALPEIPLPAGVTLRHFRPGVDDQAWLEANARAFAHHPEQGRWTEADLRLRIEEPWFDPAGFLLAVDLQDTLLGFHWTKVHDEDPPIGEIYVLGVEPGGHRRGLGRSLSVAGLAYLRDLGLAEAMLYVDEDNPAAVALYKGLDFTIWSTDVMYAKGVPTT
jgi:mycothiol synthase